MKKFVFLLNVASLSPVVAAVASYGINALAAGGLRPAGYSEYLQLQAWAAYFGSISTLCLVDLKLSPNGRLYKVFGLYGLSILAAALGLFGMLVFSLISGNGFFLTIAIVGFFYAVFRGLLMVGLTIRIPRIPITLRLVRSLLLFGLGGAALLGFVLKSTPTQFMVIQGLAAALPFLVYLPRIIAVTFSTLFPTLRLVYRHERVRLFRRNLSYMVDMAHTPLFYTAIAGVSAEKDLASLIYVIGLLLPIAFLLNEIIGERFRLRFGLMHFPDLKAKFGQVKYRVRKAVVFYRLIYLFFAAATLLACFGIIDFSEGIVLGLIVHMLFVCASSSPGLVISKAGMEVVDLSINLVVVLLLSTLLLMDAAAPVAAILASLVLCTKYLAHQTVAYTKISGSGD